MLPWTLKNTGVIISMKDPQVKYALIKQTRESNWYHTVGSG